MSVSRSDCIIFDGPKRADGYGRLFVDGKRVYAHRVAYCESHGLSLDQIEGMVIRHKCDNPPCRNPEHLLLGTHYDNVQDKVSRLRHPRRAGHGLAKLTEEQVAEMRALKTGRRGETVAIAKRYGVSSAMVSLILRGKNWRQDPAPTSTVGF